MSKSANIVLIRLTGCQVMQLDQEIQIVTASSILPWQFRKEGENLLLTDI